MALKDAKQCEHHFKDGHKKAGEQCSLPAVKGRDYCHRHKGTIPAGVAHYNYKHGAYVGQRQAQRAKAQLTPEEKAQLHRYQRFLPDYLKVIHTEALSNPDLLSLQQEIALADSMLADMLRRLHEYGDPGEGWKDLQSLMHAWDVAEKVGDVKALLKAQEGLKALVARMADSSALEERIHTQMRLIKDLRIQEHKRILDLQSQIQPEHFLLLLQSFKSILRQEILAYLEKDQAQTLLLRLDAGFRALDVRTLIGVSRNITPTLTLDTPALAPSGHAPMALEGTYAS
jgi:hypothetical protein